MYGLVHIPHDTPAGLLVHPVVRSAASCMSLSDISRMCCKYAWLFGEALEYWHGRLDCDDSNQGGPDESPRW
jgi:hypothetical protein